MMCHLTQSSQGALAALAIFTLLIGSIEGSQQAVFRAETRLVVLRATVRNSRGELVNNLDQDAFTVYQERQAAARYALSSR